MDSSNINMNDTSNPSDDEIVYYKRVTGNSVVYSRVEVERFVIREKLRRLYEGRHGISGI